MWHRAYSARLLGQQLLTLARAVSVRGPCKSRGSSYLWRLWCADFRLAPPPIATVLAIVGCDGLGAASDSATRRAAGRPTAAAARAGLPVHCFHKTKSGLALKIDE